MKYRQRVWIFAAAVILNGSQPLDAAELQKSPIPNANADLITVVGDLAPGDETKFVDLALGSSDAIVAFQSRGGDLIAGIGIGKAIHLKGFATVVPDGICASACALAWLGGNVRLMGKNARVGFHAVYSDSNGQPTVSSGGNALVGAYLNQLGLPSSAVFYITNTSPDEMQWLTFADAQNYGIDVKPFNLADTGDSSVTSDATSSPPASAFPPRTPSAPSAPTFPEADPGGQGSSSVDIVTRETYTLISAANLPNESALSYLQGKYGDEVSYYGTSFSRNDVIRDKSNFFSRWPNRNYAIDPGSLAVNCQSTISCRADGTYSWKDSGNGLNSVGSAAFSVGWLLQDGSWRVNSETSQVLKRQIFRAQNEPAAQSWGPPPPLAAGIAGLITCAILSCW